MDDRPIIVIDASVAVAWLCVEEHTPMILGAIRDWSRTGTRLVVPRAFWWEVVNALAVGHRFSGVEVLEAVHELETLEIESVEGSGPSFAPADDLDGRAISAVGVRRAIPRPGGVIGCPAGDP
jgi:hypothetical protein